MANEFKNFDAGVQERIVAAASRLECLEEPHLFVLAKSSELFDGYPGVLMADADNFEVRLVAVRAFTFNAGEFEEFPELEADEYDELFAAARGYLDTRVDIDADQAEVHFDVIDMAVVGSSNAVVRRIVNAEPTVFMETDHDFEREIFKSVEKRLDEGRDLPQGAIENVSGEACFMGTFAKPEIEAEPETETVYV